MDITATVIACGYTTFLVCIGVFFFLLIQVNASGWVLRLATQHTKAVERTCLVIYGVIFFVAIFFAYFTITDPVRMTKYLTNVFVPLRGHLTDY